MKKNIYLKPETVYLLNELKKEYKCLSESEIIRIALKNLLRKIKNKEFIEL